MAEPVETPNSTKFGRDVEIHQSVPHKFSSLNLNMIHMEFREGTTVEAEIDRFKAACLGSRWMFVHFWVRPF